MKGGGRRRCRKGKKEEEDQRTDKHTDRQRVGRRWVWLLPFRSFAVVADAAAVDGSCAKTSASTKKTAEPLTTHVKTVFPRGPLRPSLEGNPCMII